MALAQPGHRHVAAVAGHLLGRDRAALLRDVEQRLEEHPPLAPALREAAGLIGARERIEDRLDRGDPAGVLARDRVDAPQHPDEMEHRLRDEGVPELEREQLLVLEARARGLLGPDVVLRDAEVEALVQHARGFLVREGHDASDEVATRHVVRTKRDELVEQQHDEASLLLLRFGRGRGHHRRDAGRGRGARGRAAPAAAATRAARARPLWLFLAGLGVVGAQDAGAGPPRFRDEVLEEEDAIAEVGRVAQLIREGLVAGDEVDLLVLVLEGLAEGVQVAIARDDEPDVDVGPVLVQELHRAGDEDGVRPALQEPAAHALGHRDRLHAGELEGHEQGLVLRHDLGAEDRLLHADRTELGRLLQDRLEDRERGWQRAFGVLPQCVVDVLPVNEESDVGQWVSPLCRRSASHPTRSNDPLDLSPRPPDPIAWDTMSASSSTRTLQPERAPFRPSLA